MKSVLFITGYAGSGKSYVSDYISRKYGYKQFALGDKVKELTFKLLKLFEVPINSIDDLYNENKQKYRKYLQQIGTECCRGVLGNNIWCKTLFQQIRYESKIIITDLRFMNELEYFKKQYSYKFNTDIKVIKVENKNIIKMNHQSENEIDSLKYDYLIRNDYVKGSTTNIKDKPNDVFQQIDIIIDNINKSVNDNINDDDTIIMSETTATPITLDAAAQNQSHNQQHSQSNSQTQQMMERNININEINPSEISSYALGKCGEENLKNLIESVRPKYDVKTVANTGHFADIIAIDYDRNIKYVIESKLKQNITKEDVDKFERDLIDTDKNNIEGYNIVGIFVSLTADKIPSKGSINISKNKVYITRQYVSYPVFDIMFTYLEMSKDITTETKTTITKYEIPMNVYSLLANLQIQYTKNNQDIDYIKSNKQNALNIANNSDEQLKVAEMRNEFLSYLLNEFKDILPSSTNELKVKEKERLIKYLSITPIKKITKKYLLSEFKTFNDELASIGLQGFITKYKPVEEVKQNKVSDKASNKVNDKVNDKQTKPTNDKPKTNKQTKA